MARVTKDDFSPIKVLIIEIFVLGALTVFTLYWGGLYSIPVQKFVVMQLLKE